MPSKKTTTKVTKPAPASAAAPPPAADAEQSGDAVLAQAAAGAQPGQEPDLPPPPPDEAPPGPPPSLALEPEPMPAAAPAKYMPINDLADARALPDVTHGVYQRADFNSPMAIRAFKDHDGRTMAVVFTGYALAKAAINA